MTVLKDCYSGREVLRSIDDFFGDLGFDFDAEAEAAEGAGQRRSRVAGYLATLDPSDPDDRARLLGAIDMQLREWERRQEEDGGPRQDLDRLVRTLEAAGYLWDGSRLRRRTPAVVERFRWNVDLLASDHLDSDFDRIIESLDSDPADAITASRALVETACKVTLEDLGVDFDERDDLPALYKKTAIALNIDPTQHEDPVFKKILQGLATTVQGLAEIRNVLGDAHGKRRAAPRPRPRHAHVAAGASWTVVSFIAETLQERKATGRGAASTGDKGVVNDAR